MKKPPTSQKKILWFLTKASQEQNELSNPESPPCWEHWGHENMWSDANQELTNRLTIVREQAMCVL